MLLFAEAEKTLLREGIPIPFGTIIDPNKGFRDKLKKLDKDGTFKKIAAKVIASMG